MLAFLAATNHWYGWDAGIRATQALDTRDLCPDRRRGPGFPHHDIGSAFTERFAFPWVLGAAGDLFGGGPHVPFRIMFALFVVGTLVAMVDICEAARTRGLGGLLCVGLFALNPYVFRGDAIAPGPVDEAFVLGIAILIWGLVAVRFAGVMAGRDRRDPRPAKRAGRGPRRGGLAVGRGRLADHAPRERSLRSNPAQWRAC